MRACNDEFERARNPLENVDSDSASVVPFNALGWRGAAMMLACLSLHVHEYCFEVSLCCRGVVQCKCRQLSVTNVNDATWISCLVSVTS